MNLRDRAYRAMLDAQFTPNFSTEVCREIGKIDFIRSNPDFLFSNRGTAAQSELKARDLRHLHWSSIDNDESRDLDQVEFAEQLANGDIRLLIAIADVEMFVPKDSAIDRHAATNTTSIYTGVATFPMLPEELATSASSLLEGMDRFAVVVDLLVGPSGEVRTQEIFLAAVHNYAKLTYDSVGNWLEGKSDLPLKVSQTPGLKAQVELQYQAAKRLRSFREQKGALCFRTIEPKPISKNGKIIDLKVAQYNVAMGIIEAFMVTANIAVAEFLEGKGLSSLRRVVRLPKRWDRICEIARQHQKELPLEADRRALSLFLSEQKEADPLHFPDLSLSIVKLLGPGEYILEHPGKGEGHFGLAVEDYTHSTAPNRRYADLIIQRCLKAVIRGNAMPYTDEELMQIAAHCTERENAIRKIERLMRKVIAAEALQPREGQLFDALVTGASSKGTYVRLLDWPAEGRVIRGEHGMDVGDKVRVRLISTDAWRGFIDFEKI